MTPELDNDSFTEDELDKLTEGIESGEQALYYESIIRESKRLLRKEISEAVDTPLFRPAQYTPFTWFVNVS